LQLGAHRQGAAYRNPAQRIAAQGRPTRLTYKDSNVHLNVYSSIAASALLHGGEVLGTIVAALVISCLIGLTALLSLLAVDKI
jgi:hypothetical protein